MKTIKSIVVIAVITIGLLACILHAQESSARTVGLIWDANPISDNVSHYTIYRSTTSGGPWKQVFTVPGSVTNAVVSYYGGANYWVVSASNTAGESEYSNEVSLNSRPGRANGLKFNKQ